MKGLFYFAGSLLRWPGKHPKQFLFLHAYILMVYFFAYLIKSSDADFSGLALSIGALAPMFLLISRGLPLDCLHYKSAIQKEFGRQ